MEHVQRQISVLPVWQSLGDRQLPARNRGKPLSRTSGTLAWDGSSWSPQSPHPRFLWRVTEKCFYFFNKNMLLNSHTLCKLHPPLRAQPNTVSAGSVTSREALLGDLCLTFHLEYLVFYHTLGGNQDLSTQEQAEIKQSYIKVTAASSKHVYRYTETSGSPRDPEPLAAEGVKLHD